MRHVMVSRFSVPRLDAATAQAHCDPAWLASRLELFRRYFVPSVEGLGVPTILLCSSESAPRVAEEARDLPWITVVEQNDWYGGWTGSEDQIVTRLDSDDAVHAGWLEALDAAPPDYDVYCTKRFLRFDEQRHKLYARRRNEPSPLAAFRRGANPYAHDHKRLERHYATFSMPEAYLLQVVHGGNLSNRRPRWWHSPMKVPLARLTAFGLSE